MIFPDQDYAKAFRLLNLAGVRGMRFVSKEHIGQLVKAIWPNDIIEDAEEFEYIDGVMLTARIPDGLRPQQPVCIT